MLSRHPMNLQNAFKHLIEFFELLTMSITDDYFVRTVLRYSDILCPEQAFLNVGNMNSQLSRE